MGKRKIKPKASKYSKSPFCYLDVQITYVRVIFPVNKWLLSFLKWLFVLKRIILLVLMLRTGFRIMPETSYIAHQKKLITPLWGTQETRRWLLLKNEFAPESVRQTGTTNKDTYSYLAYRTNQTRKQRCTTPPHYPYVSNLATQHYLVSICLCSVSVARSNLVNWFLWAGFGSAYIFILYIRSNNCKQIWNF